ncbi:MAG: GGDEF domain-containing protein [Elusimicrobia bacterium]|nr:GGDEF domain-containing protein [Elusimicrobiota bacterium]
MNNLSPVLMAFAPVAAYGFGRLNRFLGIIAGLAFFIAGFFITPQADFQAVPFIVFSLWCAAAFVHSFILNSFKHDPVLSLKSKKLAEDMKTAAEDIEKLKKELLNISISERKAVVLYSAIKLLSETVDFETAGKMLSKYIKDYFEIDDFALYIKNSIADSMLIRFASGKNEKFNEKGWAVLEQILTSGVDSFAKPHLEGASPVKFVVPAIHSGETIAIFAGISETPEMHGENLIEKAVDFCSKIAFAVKRIDLFRQVERLSRIDGLTGVFRRNVLDEKIAEEIRRARTFKTTFGLMIADIDRFKNLNDAYGHQFGDAVLRRVGEILKDSVYETDFVGRYGGEEFGIVLPRADYAGVLRKAEFVRRRIASENFTQGLESVKITLSIGIAHFPRDGSAAEEIIMAADKALYRAKETGRNRVVEASSI